MREDAYRLRTRRAKAYYSLDRGDGIENAVIFTALAPDEIYQRRLAYEQLHAAIATLSDKQARRIYAHYILGVSKADIARAEGVNKAQVSKSIKKGLGHLKDIIKKWG